MSDDDQIPQNAQGEIRWVNQDQMSACHSVGECNRAAGNSARRTFTFCRLSGSLGVVAVGDHPERPDDEVCNQQEHRDPDHDDEQSSHSA
jgi:hypothetical protein